MDIGRQLVLAVEDGVTGVFYLVLGGVAMPVYRNPAKLHCLYERMQYVKTTQNKSYTR